jgi:mannosyltransferase OCH1-like enzyme
MIPKIIWQTHNYLYDEMPDHVKKCMKTWIHLNPGWEHRYVNHTEREDFVKSRSKQLYDLYLISRPQAQSDIWRLLALYEYGGVYCDMDSVCIKPLDYLLQNYNNQEFISVKPYPDGRINIANFAVPEKSKIMSDIIKTTTTDKLESLDWHVWNSFNKHITSIPKEDMFFDAEWHSAIYKEEFIEENLVDYYGEKMQYRDYLKNILKLNEEDYISSINN